MISTEELLRADAEARRTALDVTRSFIVQAPAGSGKTELLTQRFLALLAVVERPEALLAITFTRKAAAEMRHRILEALRGCRDAGSSLRDDTRALAQRALENDTTRGWGLLANPGRLRVLTIDALNQSLARRLPVLSGLGAGLAIDEDGTELYRLAAERLLQHLPADDPRIGAAVTALLEHFDNDVNRFADLVASMLARREAWLPELPADVAAYGDEGAVRDELEAGRRELIVAHLESLVAAFPEGLLEELHGYAASAAEVLRQAGDDKSPIVQCDGTLPGAEPEDVPRWQGLATFLLTSSGSPRKSFTRSVGVLPKDRKHPEREALKQCIETAAEQFAEYPELHELLHAARELPPPRYEDSEWRVLKSLLLVLRVAAAELKAVFAERRTADYPEFAAAARQSLGTPDEPTDTALALDARVHHILVDEFQDTSEAQVQLLEGLTAGWQRDDGRTLFLVGDPMQSIYRFRNAEVGLFLNVRDHGLGSVRLEPLTLRVNFRSTRQIVEWVNDCFARVLPPHDDVVRGAVRFAESVASPTARTLDDSGVTVHAFLRSSRQHEARRVADLVEARLAASETGCIGILVQGRGDLIEIVAELARRNIAYQATDIDPLAERQVVLDLLALTRALAHPGDRAAWLGMLRAPWCGLRLADCLVLLGDDRYATALSLLQDESRRARLEAGARSRLERCLPVLERALEERSRLGLRDAVERAWHALGGPATLPEARAIDEARAYLDALGKLEADARGEPLDLGRLTLALQKLYAPTPASAQTRVELLTIHKSKGLQFDTVIVPGLDRLGGSDSAPLLRWLKVPGSQGHRLIVAPIAEAGAETANPLHAWLGRLEREKLLQEKRRLLYVAATRAERSLHLLGSCAVDEKDGQYAVRRPKQGSALAMLWALPAIPAAFEARLAEIGAIEGEEGRVVEREPKLPRVPDGWSLPALPAAPRLPAEPRAHGAAAPSLHFDWASETARHVGTVVHRELQRLTKSGSAVKVSDEEAAVWLGRYVIELAELGVPADRREAAAQRVLDAVRRTLDDERGRWLLHGPHRDAQSELGLTGRWGDEVLSIVIDRTFVDAKTGTRWIVDYKTSAHEGAGLDEFLDNERTRYQPQLERYAALLRHWSDEPIRLGLYFPLLSAWREWEPGAL